MSIDSTPNAIQELALDSGGYAMVALDQRESLRNMFSERGRKASDEDLLGFKAAACEALAPLASAILLDKHSCGSATTYLGDTPLILAVDEFDQPAGEMLLDSWVDHAITPDTAASCGATALKQLVVWSADAPPTQREAIMSDFEQLCSKSGLPGIVEAVVRPPADPGRSWDRDEAILAAAAEFAAYDFDLYKAEVPGYGRGDKQNLERQCRAITEELRGRPWVVLSSGVEASDFPDAVRIACSGGASGFLAGRAVWADCVGRPREDLRQRAVARLKTLVEIVEDAVRLSGREA